MFIKLNVRNLLTNKTSSERLASGIWHLLLSGNHWIHSPKSLPDSSITTPIFTYDRTAIILAYYCFVLPDFDTSLWIFCHLYPTRTINHLHWLPFRSCWRSCCLRWLYWPMRSPHATSCLLIILFNHWYWWPSWRPLLWNQLEKVWHAVLVFSVPLPFCVFGSISSTHGM